MDDLRRAAAGAAHVEIPDGPASIPATTLVAAPARQPRRTATDASSLPSSSAAGGPKRAAAGAKPRAAAEVAAGPSHRAAPPPATVRRPKSAARDAAGQRIIERHANMAVLAGLVPVPLVDMAAIAAVVDRMLRKLARVYGRRLQRDRSARLATSMLAGVAAPGIARWTATNLLGLIPGTQLIGMALGSLSATVVVRSIGEAFHRRLKAERAERDPRPAVGPDASVETARPSPSS
ncbi:YcjF family protein [Aureimonas glaciei]|uniref:YcjF family protein n=1 Tax=Aureimonas glaciei TaxID=1776957 RepID=UPI0016694EC3|nr:YcjF family protein [Aureimonas glaciei]